MSGVIRIRVAIAAAMIASLWPTPSSAQGVPPLNEAAASSSIELDTHDGHASQAGPAPPAAAGDDHSAHQEPAAASQQTSNRTITDADRAAAFPDVAGHAVHDRALSHFILFDQLEWQPADKADGVSWDGKGWIGGDRNRIRLRTEGDAFGGRLATGQAHVLFSRSITRWWDVVAGVRQDVRPGPAQTWAAVGIQGLAPYRFDVEATAYVGGSGRTHFRFEGEHDLLLTNRLVLQPLAEVEIYGRSDSEHEMGAGLSFADLGLRLRYELRREFAPYVGIVWTRKFFETADLAGAAGGRSAWARLAVGFRVWR
jgi:copper resistance protein B